MNKELLRLAIPNIISNVSVPLLSTVDTALMGNISVLHLGAIGLGAMVFNFLYWNFGFLRMGTTGLVAQAYGMNDTSRSRDLLYRSACLSLMISMGILVLSPYLFQVSIAALAISKEMIPLVHTYFGILIWAAPGSLLTFVLMGWLFGMQNSRLPMFVTIIINITNVLLSYYLVYTRGLGIQGVAMGTLISIYMGCLILLVSIFIKYPIIRFLPTIKGNWTDFLIVNSDLFIRTVALTFAFGFFYRQSSASGPIVLAANIIFLQLLNWMSYGIDGFAYAAESMVGKYYGSRDKSGLQRTMDLSFKWGFALSIFYALIYSVGHRPIVSLYTSDLDVIAFLDHYKYWIALIPLGAFLCYIWDGIYIGLTSSAEMRDTMMVSLGLYIGLYFTIRSHSSNAIWISLMVFLVFRGIIQWLWWRYKVRKRIFAK